MSKFKSYKRLNINYSLGEQHPFHLVNISPWPFMTSISLFTTVLSFVFYFHYFNSAINYVCCSFIVLSFYLFRWFTDIIDESSIYGYHTLKVQRGIRLGMCLFIASEIMFFFSFFWAFFHASLAPSIDIGCLWAPAGIIRIDPWGLPLLNTVLLLTSGLTVTWAHRAALSGSWFEVSKGLYATIVYGTIFTLIQYYEYTVAPFSINDSIYGSLFFILTGFHGIHVLVGTFFLFVCLVRHFKLNFTVNHHVGLEAAIWYWHFVDVVWMFLFITVYIWGGI